LWSDPTLNIWWPIPNPIVSQRDQGNAKLERSRRT
jgi:dTDP-4-dehydrorhamnose 3,5-epimerase